MAVRGTRMTRFERRCAIRFLPISGKVGRPLPSNEARAIRALSIVPSAMITIPPGARSIRPRLVSTPVMRQVPAAVRSLARVRTWVSGSTMKSFLPSDTLPKDAVRAAFISSGTVLNLFKGKKPACGERACTASGASSFNILRRSAAERPSGPLKPRSSSGSAPGLSTGDGGNEGNAMTSFTEPMASKSCRLSTRCSSPKMKSFVSSTPI